MNIGNTDIVDTFAEAFSMVGTRIIITAETDAWAMAAARAMTGFATSVIGCKCEAGIEKTLAADETPDRRPGVSVLLFTMDKKSIGTRLVERIGQCVMTCPTTACFNGLSAPDSVVVGGQLRYFGDGFQMSKVINSNRLWRIPVMDGEFLVDESFSITTAVGGGNLLLIGHDRAGTLAAAEQTTAAMRIIDDIILPFPDGVVRSGSKVGSKYKSLIASTNDAYCPTLRAVSKQSALPESAQCVLEIVIDGLTEDAVKQAMQTGMKAAAAAGILQISAGNYGGSLGQYKINLKDLVN
jgi:formylmethanofuran--tetrahydromethanopterin N-formyltransferase